MKPTQHFTLWKSIPLVGLFALASCQALEEKIRPKQDEVELKIPENFDFATIKEVDINITTKDLKGNAISVPQIGIYDKNPDEGGQLLYVTGTSETGNVIDGYSIPAYLESVFIENNIPGLSNSVVSVKNGKLDLVLTAPEVNKGGRVSEIPVREYYGFTGTSAGYILYEDIWPNRGDFDLNDLAMKYLFVNNSNLLPATPPPGPGRIKKLEATFDVVAIGATYNNGFSLHFPKRGGTPASAQTFTPADVQSAFISKNGGAPVPIIPVFDPNGNGVIFDIFTPTELSADFLNTNSNTAGACGPSAKLTIIFNDRDVTTINSGVPSGIVGIAPYDPFLYVNGNINQEVHLYTKTKTFRSTYNSPPGSDDPDDDYRDTAGQGMPFAIIVPSNPPTVSNGFKFLVPKEKVAIFNAYPDFATWANSGGGDSPEWYKNPDNSKVVANTCK